MDKMVMVVHKVVVHNMASTPWMVVVAVVHHSRSWMVVVVEVQMRSMVPVCEWASLKLVV